MKKQFGLPSAVAMMVVAGTLLFLNSQKYAIVPKIYAYGWPWVAYYCQAVEGLEGHIGKGHARGPGVEYIPFMGNVVVALVMIVSVAVIVERMSVMHTKRSPEH